MSVEAYEALQRGLELLTSGSAHAAVQPLERARDLEPGKGSVREALARAYFNARHYAKARDEFAETVAINPANDYAHFGLGLSLLRLGDRTTARGHLRMAVAMNPDSDDYAQALARADR